MKYRVEWRKKAQFELLDLWAAMEGDAYAEVAEAINEIERRLSSNPLDEGESRIGEVRITFEKMVGIEFVVAPADRIVFVTAAWHYRSH